MIDDEMAAARPDAVERVVFCSGKVYYDLKTARDDRFDNPAAVALVRLEQLHPWPEAEIVSVMQRYANATTVVWAQEEPANMGAWTFVRERIQGEIRSSQKLLYAGQSESASPATGSMRIHRDEQAALVASAFAHTAVSRRC